MNNIKTIKGLGIAIKIIAIIIRVILSISFIAILVASLITLFSNEFNISGDISCGVTTNISVPALKDVFEDKIIENNDNFYLETSKDGNMLMTAVANDEKFSFSVNKFGYIGLAVTVSLICAFIIMVFVGKLGNIISKSETPFTPQVIKYLKCIGFSLLAWLIVPKIAMAAAVYFVMPFIGINFSLNIDLISVILALLFIMLIYVFQYGVALQQESDETL